MTYRLIDTDTRETVAIANTEAEALAATPYLPGDCVPDATTWDEVVEAARQHADGIPGVVEGYAIERLDRAWFGRRNEDGSVSVLHVADGEPVTRIPSEPVLWPVGSSLSARYDNPEGIRLTAEDAAKLGLQIEE